MASTLHARDITVQSHTTTIVEGVNLAVEAGHTLVIVGESGAGKSMVARAITGLLPPGLSASGNVTIADTSIDLAHPGHQFNQVRGSRIVWLPQDPFTSLSPSHRIDHQILARPPRNHHLRRQLVADRLTEVGLDEQLDSAYPHELSGGMRQRVAIASALDPQPSVLIADEPTTALDVATQREILDLLSTLKHERSMALILITHDLGLARDYGDDVLIMRHGHVVESGEVATILSQPATTYTRSLVDAEPRISGPSPRAPYTKPAEEITPILSVTDAVKSFGHQRALNHVSLSIRPGEAVGIVGESGCGKTTLARSIVGLETLDSGTIDLHIRPRPRSRSEKPQWLIEQRQAVQIVFQNPYSALNPSLSIGSAIREALRSVGRDPAEAATLLDHVGLPASYISRLPAELSGGERQRVAIARALAPQPRLLICDEAVSALDVSIQAQILELLASIQSKLGIALLFITHDLAVARQVSDRLLVMKDGAVVDSGLTEKLLVSPTHAYTRELLESVPGNAHDHTSAGSPR